jgi:hypothetical protein
MPQHVQFIWILTHLQPGSLVPEPASHFAGVQHGKWIWNTEKYMNCERRFHFFTYL